jgi:hypothetical protein
MRPEFNELILTAEKSKKKGGSLGAVFKLIQDLTEFEEKIQECCDSQEMTENKEKIEAFLMDIDKMYEVLLGIAKGGISSIRNERRRKDMFPEQDGVEEVQESTVPVEEVEEVELDKSPVKLNIPKVPRM